MCVIENRNCDELIACARWTISYLPDLKRIIVVSTMQRILLLVTVSFLLAISGIVQGYNSPYIPLIWRHWMWFIFSICVAHSKSSCSRPMNEFIEAVLQFKRCEMQHAVPATICTTCLVDYGNVLSTYRVFENAIDDKVPGQRCAAAVIDKNRLNAIPNELASVHKIWNDAYCASKCITADTLLWTNQPSDEKWVSRRIKYIIFFVVFCLYYIYYLLCSHICFCPSITWMWSLP